jgi:hypothetical protein
VANDEENKQPIEQTLESEPNATESKEVQSESNKNGDESIQDNVSQNENLDNLIDESENLTQKKAKKLNKVLVIVVGVLLGVLLIGIILFFIGVFDSEEVTPPPVATTTDQQNPAQATDGATTNQQAEVAIPAYEFKTTDINVPRLNKKLQALIDAPIQKENEVEETVQLAQNNTDQLSSGTFYDEELEALLPKEEQNIALVQQPEQTIPTDTNNTDTKTTEEQETKKDELVDNKLTEKELVATPKQESTTNQTTVIEDKKESQNSTIKEESEQVHPTIKDETKNNGHHFLKFIQVATLKYKLYTQFLREIKAVDARISICQNDNGRIQIFIGPFLDDKQRSFVIEQINKSVVNDAFGLEFTQEEYFRRCGIKDPS